MNRQDFITDQKSWRVSCHKCGGIKQCSCDEFQQWMKAAAEYMAEIIYPETHFRPHMHFNHFLELPPNVVRAPANETAGILEMLGNGADMIILDDHE